MKTMQKFISLIIEVILALSLLSAVALADDEPELDAGIQAMGSISNLGGWYTPESTEITPELQEIFDKGMEGLAGATYTAKELLAEQVAAGKNYCFLCDAQVVYPGAEVYEAKVYMYADLQGNVEITDIVNLNEPEDDIITPQEYFITYDPNGGAFDGPEDLIHSTTKFPSWPVALSDEIPERSGYVFIGWAASADADEPEYQPGDSYSQNADITLYAVWEALVEGETEIIPPVDPMMETAVQYLKDGEPYQAALVLKEIVGFGKEGQGSCDTTIH